MCRRGETVKVFICDIAGSEFKLQFRYVYIRVNKYFLLPLSWVIRRLPFQ